CLFTEAAWAAVTIPSFGNAKYYYDFSKVSLPKISNNTVVVKYLPNIDSKYQVDKTKFASYQQAIADLALSSQRIIETRGEKGEVAETLLVEQTEKWGTYLQTTKILVPTIADNIKFWGTDYKSLDSFLNDIIAYMPTKDTRRALIKNNGWYLLRSFRLGIMQINQTYIDKFNLEQNNTNTRINNCNNYGYCSITFQQCKNENCKDITKDFGVQKRDFASYLRLRFYFEKNRINQEYQKAIKDYNQIFALSFQAFLDQIPMANN
nr:hypothetical protein [Candidatus Gracilibacteria bacterium]